MEQRSNEVAGRLEGFLGLPIPHAAHETRQVTIIESLRANVYTRMKRHTSHQRLGQFTVLGQWNSHVPIYHGARCPEQNGREISFFFLLLSLCSLCSLGGGGVSFEASKQYIHMRKDTLEAVGLDLFLWVGLFLA
ncbi:hypothetical protein GGTG_03190 [Gaeumannomyces tritici R3-111a-1]|uniref:Uncharacterized protein n=1 Tax=Gaeumannomyces tritici (strain R3-111a-1) TaxID=644352 RepID=J3NPI2_GAET3|nr:hypothetical protein GGTG_03190 [Gaeumannomyces tritici R3-111a-1]EJT78087.1 hypothetical protein GGTG_03190 [Gaeumannomyces tritici R3-111a-1]